MQWAPATVRSTDDRAPSKRPAIDRWLELAIAPHSPEVGQSPPRRDQPSETVVRQLAISLVRDRTDDEIVAAAVRLGDFEAVFALDLLGAGERVRDLDLMPEPGQPPNQVEAAAVAEVGHILLEGEAEHQSGSGLAPPVVQRVGDP